MIPYAEYDNKTTYRHRKHLQAAAEFYKCSYIAEMIHKLYNELRASNEVAEYLGWWFTGNFVLNHLHQMEAAVQGKGGYSQKRAEAYNKKRRVI